MVADLLITYNKSKMTQKNNSLTNFFNTKAAKNIII